MIIAKDLIQLLQKFDPCSEVVIYDGDRAGLHLSSPNDEPLGWIEVGDYKNRVMLDDQNHQIERQAAEQSAAIDAGAGC